MGSLGREMAVFYWCPLKQQDKKALFRILELAYTGWTSASQRWTLFCYLKGNPKDTDHVRPLC